MNKCQDAGTQMDLSTVTNLLPIIGSAPKERFDAIDTNSAECASILSKIAESSSITAEKVQLNTVTSTKLIIELLLTEFSPLQMCYMYQLLGFSVPLWCFTISIYCNYNRTGTYAYSFFTFVTCNKLGFILNGMLICTYNKMNTLPYIPTQQWGPNSANECYNAKNNYHQ